MLSFLIVNYLKLHYHGMGGVEGTAAGVEALVDVLRPSQNLDDTMSSFGVTSPDCQVY